MATLTLKNLRKAYSETSIPVKGVDITVEPGEFLTLLGPSGCGKSTILRLIAGLEPPTDGEIRIGDQDVTNVSPGDRNISMVFQSYALYPHMSVAENIASGLKMRKVPAGEIQDRIYEVCQFLGLEPLMNRKPGQLSGGQRQRVAVARALVRQPEVFLLDEPLSNLDALLREQVRAELKQLFGKQDAPVVYVTHDQTEAMTMSSRVAVLYGGEVQQLDTPQQIYSNPANKFVAGFIGSPQMNFFTLPVHNRKVALGQMILAVPEAAVTAKSVILAVRPEHVELAHGDTEQVTGKVTLVENLGMSNLVTIEIAGADGETYMLRGMLPVERRYTVGESIGLTMSPENLRWFDAATELAL
ncbi:ABC transporter ATP-binding protein [filamentous cyanobacterium LEGE 11480]|uniref:ABC transporter ATP-binding protein n=1 Tax=Romeriopsis navalis LEGE 11480 TaxID=2777977 RepID=A0A928Z6J7_9CYAN|nr:ABC transporter ATP-binding protein [Romeriopsis navalis]MBE9033092.1 ABC transporter ATP-binding protein [Romeriopsis navalis LEGE 11480]